MWFKKRVEPVQPDYTKLFNAIFESFKIMEHRISSLEIGVDTLKVRMKKKLLEPVEDENKGFNNDMCLPM
jgi:hypothetical protein